MAWSKRGTLRVVGIVLLAGVVACLTWWGAVTVRDRRAVRVAVEELKSPDFYVRAAAGRVLWQKGRKSLEPLRTAVKLSDARMPDLVRAHELLVGGALDAAMGIVRRHQKANPANGLLTSIFVAELGRLDHAAEAEEVFRRRFDVLAEACRRSPDDASRHNALAWYCAVWARELDIALKHAQRGLEIAPGDHMILDTLAMVHFQRGEFQEARVAQTRCVEMQPWLLSYRQRLKDFQKPDEELRRQVGPWSMVRALRE